MEHRACGRVVRGGLPAAAVLGLLAAWLGGGPAASAGQDEGTAQAPATITIKLDERGLRFTGPEEVTAGQMLRISNTTAVKRIGPHTFTLAQGRLLPKTRRAIRRCNRRGRICRRAAAAHRFNFRTAEVGLALVEQGEEGWDVPFSAHDTGDSWYTEHKGERFAQVVSSAAGTTLHYLCTIHPELSGRIEVVEGEETAPQ